MALKLNRFCYNYLNDVNFDEEEVLLQVKYEQDICGFYPLNKLYDDFPYTDFEVMGNIYENSELIEL